MKFYMFKGPKFLCILLMSFSMLGCSFNTVTYYKPHGTGSRAAYCGSPFRVLKSEIIEGVTFTIETYKYEIDEPWKLYIMFEILEPNEVQLISPILTLKSEQSEAPKKYKIENFVSRSYGLNTKVDALEPLVGKTYKNTGFWGSIYGMRYEHITDLGDFKSKHFVVEMPNIKINGNTYDLDKVTFILTTETIFSGICP